MVVAYQAGIPIVALANTGGWSGKMAGEYFDDRKRLKVEACTTPKKRLKPLSGWLKQPSNA